MTVRERLGREYSSLTPREQDVTVGIAKGLTNREIAAQIGLAEQSIKNLNCAIMRKMKVTNRVQVALLARGINPKSD